MPKRVKFKPHEVKPRNSVATEKSKESGEPEKPEKRRLSKWRLNIPASFTESKKRERRFFKTKKEAEDHAESLKAKREEFGSHAKSIRPSLAEAATKAEALLEPFGISLLDAVERIVAMESQARASQPVAEAVAEFEATKETKSASRQRELRYLREAMTELFGDRMLSELGGKEIAEGFANRFPKASTFNRRIEDAARFIRWASHKSRGWCDASETEFFEKRETKRGRVKVMTSK